MKEIIVNFDKKKKFKLLFQFLGISVISIIIIFIISNSKTIFVNYLFIFYIILIATLVMSIKLLFDVIRKPKMGLKIDDKGLLFLGTLTGKKIGEVKWKDIEEISQYDAYGVNNYYIKLKSPKKYIKNKSNNEMLNSGLMINASEIEITYQKLGNLLEEYHNKYK